MSSHHPLEPSQEFGACRYLRHTGNPPLAPLRPGAADAEPKEGETLALCEIDATRLVTIEFHVECGQFLQKPLVHGRLKPPPPAVAVDQDHQVSRPGESHPRALAELYVNVSAHTAPIIQPPASPSADANGRTARARDEQGHRANGWRDGDVAVAFCISAWPIEPTSAIKVAEDRIQGRFVETAVVLNPPAKDRIPHAGQVVDGLVAAPREMPTSHRLPHPRRCRIAHRRREADEVLTPPILRPTRAKRVAQRPSTGSTWTRGPSSR